MQASGGGQRQLQQQGEVQQQVPLRPEPDVAQQQQEVQQNPEQLPQQQQQQAEQQQQQLLDEKYRCPDKANTADLPVLKIQQILKTKKPRQPTDVTLVTQLSFERWAGPCSHVGLRAASPAVRRHKALLMPRSEFYHEGPC
jgi:hypothetical protein